MYFANNEGLLGFDGQSWRLRTMPGNIIVRSVASDNSGQVYSGGLKEFGIWKPDAYGRMNYQSLVALLPEEDRPVDEVWKIYTHRDEVLFQTFSAVFRYRNNELQRIAIPGIALFLFQAGERFFLEVLDDGIYELDEDRFVKRLDAAAIGGGRVLTMLPFGNEVLIGTAQNGLFRWKDDQLTAWETELSSALRQEQLNNGIALPGGQFAFGTILNGLYVMDSEGHQLYHLNKANGLQNNTVLSLGLDQQHNLWIGLDNGIDRVEINTPFFYYTDLSGRLGTVYTAAIYQGDLYLGTNQGLYRSPWSPQNRFSFQLVPGSQGQVWDLRVIDGQLICGHNDGTFRVAPDRLVRISDLNGGYVLKGSLKKGKLFIQGTYTGLSLFEQSGQQLVWRTKIAGFDKPVQFFQEEDGNRLWVSGYQGLFRLQLDSAYKRVLAAEQYGPEQGLPESRFNSITEIGGRTMFATDSGFYLYDDIADEFHAYDQLNERLGSFASANTVIPVAEGQYWFAKRGHLAWVEFLRSGQVGVDSVKFAGLAGRILSFYEYVSELAPSLYLISLDDGFALYRAKQHVQQARGTSRPVVKRVEDITEGGGLELPFLNGAFKLNHQQNNIRIAYALARYYSQPVHYQSQLSGIHDGWSDWSMVAEREFTNLPAGDYVFKVRARTPDGLVSEVGEWSFSVLPPWYRSWKAYAVYFLLLGGLVYGGYLLYLRNLRKHRLALQLKLEREARDRSRQQEAEAEQQLMQVKTEQLETELAGKNRELANSAMNIVYKNELLSKIHDEILSLKDRQGKSLSTEQLKKINQVIEDARSDERDWDLFEESFNEAHENFFKKLKSRYAELVPNDLKLCAYLRMNMSSKEIASLLNITTRGVEIRRYRLRKKLLLQHDQNLTEFLMSV